MAKLCLNMIVKNEAARLVRCLDSVLPYIDAWAIVDTGSTDNTRDLIRDYFKDAGIPGKIRELPFINFEQARNAALVLARSSPFEYDYILLTDADMELVVEDKDFRDKLTAPVYNVVQKAGVISYGNTRLLHRDNQGVYRGVTHEYYDGGPAANLDTIWFIDHADGANRPDKFKRDIDLLQKALETDPNNERYWFYLGQSQRDAGLFAQAALSYRKRVSLGGWDEEVWNAQVNLAHSLNGMDDTAGFLENMLIAYNMRPQRAEALYDLANHFRNRGKNAISTLFSEAGMTRKRPDDLLFVNDYVYSYGLKEEFAITAFYDPAKRDQGFKVCNELALDAKAPHNTREQAKSNLLYYMPTLVEIAPSFKSQVLDIGPPAGWTAMNPSVAVHDGAIYAIVRTVNYTMNEWGGYDINKQGGAITDENPIETRNWLTRLKHDLTILDTWEIAMPKDRPNPLYKPVLGFEDMRLFSWRKELWCSSCVREMNAEGYCEQVLAHLQKTDYGRYILDKCHKMLPEQRLYEKNWAPYVNGGTDLRFVYRLGQLVDTAGNIVADEPTGKSVEHISGGTQYVPFSNDMWLSIVHEARFLPGTEKRYYYHRFATMNGAGKLLNLSRPFVFHDKQVEFAAGLAIHPDRQRLIISYGVRDCEARIATIDKSDLWELLYEA